MRFDLYLPENRNAGSIRKAAILAALQNFVYRTILPDAHETNQMEIAAGEEQTIAVPCNCQEPAEMSIFGAESYLITPIAIHASIAVVLAAEEKGKFSINNTQTVNSSWVELYVGYPLD